jgi:glycosyltransferase involved in cell wall biosynthesis
MNPYFTIVIATFNNSSKLIDCIESLNAQSFAAYEVVISDGGSLDDTSIYLRGDGVRNLAWFKSEPDGGIYDALNIALLAATGRWVLVLGDDDILSDNDALARAYEFISKDANEPLFYYSDIIIKSGDKTRLKKYPQIDLFDSLYSGGPFFHHQSVFFKRSAIIEVGRFDLRYKIHADYDLLLRAHLIRPAKKINSAFVIYNDSGYSSKINNIARSFYEVSNIRFRSGINILSIRILAIYMKLIFKRLFIFT